MLNSNLDISGKFLEYYALSQIGEKIYTNDIFKVKYLYVIMQYSNYLLQPTMLPIDHFSFNDEYVVAYNDGGSLYSVRFKINRANNSINILQLQKAEKVFFVLIN